MFKAKDIGLLLIHVSGDEMSCFQVNDTLVPDGYATEKNAELESLRWQV